MKQYRFIWMILTAALMAALVTPAAAGTISGTVKVKGLPSPAGVLVYLNTAPQIDADVSQVKFVMDQKNLAFIPDILPIPVGATVVFPNNDQLNHNVFSLSKTKTFNLGSYGPGESKTVVFDQPGIVELRCDVHAEMLAYILVMKSPYFGLTDAKGHFSIPDKTYLSAHGITNIPDLPAGTYTVKTRHAKLKTAKHTVQVRDNGEATTEITLSRGAAGVLYK